MKQMRDKARLEAGQAQSLPAYEPPRVLSYHEEEILEMLGPAQACSFYGSVLECNPLLPFSPGLPVLRP